MSELEKVTAVTTEYDASEIQVLEGLEAVRKRPGMYIGSTSASGLHHLVYEIVDNAIDEALAGYCTDITVTINEGNTITVTDNGRGIPVDIQKQTGRPALEVVYTVLHAGGKFGGGGYKVSGGLHGVGASVVNALSEWLEVEVHKGGKIYQMKFSRGAITQEMTVIGDTDHTGTIVRLKPDGEMFDTLEYDYETLHTRMREQAFLNAGLRISIADRRPGQEQEDTMCYEGGIREFVTWINRNKTPLHEEVIYMAGAKGDSTAEIAMQYNDSYAETMVSFANDIHTPEGGMHETGFKAALTRVLNAYGIKYGMIKEGDKVSGEDVREGITAVISVKLTEAQFEGQTKAKLGNAYIRTLVDGLVSDQLSVYLEEHPVVARTILDKALTANRAREAARKARESIRRKTALGGAAMPDKLLYVAADAPARGQTVPDYTALGKAADRLVLRLPAYTDSEAAVPVYAMEPPETVYYALSILTRQVSAEKLSLRLTAEGRCLEGNKSYAPTADTRTAVLAQGSTHYSDRYACAYTQSGKLTLWYLNGRSLTERQQLLRCFGADSVCLSTGSGTLSLTAE